jgi:methyl-accepting chemotaxis protein
MQGAASNFLRGCADNQVSLRSKESRMSENGETVRLLRGIWNEMKAVNNRINETNARLAQTNVRLEEGFAEVNARLDQTNARLDQTNARLDQTNARLEHVVEFIGERYREHSRTLRAFDKRLTRLESRTSR